MQLGVDITTTKLPYQPSVDPTDICFQLKNISKHLARWNNIDYDEGTISILEQAFQNPVSITSLFLAGNKHRSKDFYASRIRILVADDLLYLSHKKSFYKYYKLTPKGHQLLKDLS